MQSQDLLILDGEEAVRDSLQLVLSDEGYNCFTSPNYSDALRLLESHNIAVIIMESELAVKTGFLKVIKEKYPQIKSFVISSYFSLEANRIALIKDADEFILKPLNFDELLSLLHSYIPSVSS